MKHFTTIVLGFLFLISDINAQKDKLLESNKAGLEILRNCFKVHGGVFATDSLKLKFTVINNKIITPGQSYAANDPVDEYEAISEYSIDRPNKKEVVSAKTPMSGFVFEMAVIPVNGKWEFYANDRKKFGDVPNGRSFSTIFLPQNTLDGIIKNPYSVRLIGQEIINKIPVYHITGVASNNFYELFIDKKTNLLREVDQTVLSRAYGDAISKIVYSKYVKIKEVQVPQQVEQINYNYVTGTAIHVFQLKDITTEFEIPPSALQIPEGYTKLDFSYRKNAEIKKLGRDVYFIENTALAGPSDPFSYNVVFAEFEDFILVAEAPFDNPTSERVISKIKATIPGKPIKYLVQSHHHEDHIGGIRTYIAEGATIIVSPTNLELINRMAAAPYNGNPDRLSKNPRKAIVEAVTNTKRTIVDKRNEAVIYEIGPNEHTKEMLMVYFPEQKILFQADQINEDEFPPTKTSREFITKLKTLQLKVDILAGVHGKLLEGKSVDDLINSLE